MVRGFENVSDATRKAMRAVKSANTAPEMLVRRMAHRMGFRYRLHRKDLPGKPDLVFASRKKVVFVHGCFWHAHSCARGARIPKSRGEYWTAKLEGNAERDRQNQKALENSGWKVLTIWECQLSNPEDAARSLKSFLCAPVSPS